MDDNQSSRTAEAGAKRKRRSSILKQQRASRAPFSELEFNVATPTDTAKSRRVSFSRRKGVAEFVTNEATTTWKNFYEEQNKTLESSGNESEVNPPRPSVGHISKALFDQHFQDAEEIDLDDGKGRSLEIFIDLDKTKTETREESLKINVPLEMSLLTDQQSKVFGDVFCVSDIGEVTDRIGVNFSDIQPIVQTKDSSKDDLDEIERDLQKCHSNDLWQNQMQDNQSTSMFDGKNKSEYFELDFNTTNVGIRNEESDMSITDTIHSPKVQAVSKASFSIEKKVSELKDWVADKENILVVNPYVAPKESLNFNTDHDKVLVFDGKRLTVEEDKIKSDENFRKTLLPNSVPDRTPVARKIIVLNVNDDLPNVSSTAHMSVKGINVNQTVYHNDDLSFTKPAPINFDQDVCDLSITEAVPAKIELAPAEKRKTVVYDNDTSEISLTDAIPSNFVFVDENNQQGRRQTILYEDKESNISITEAIPTNLVLTSEENMVKDAMADISMTRCVPTKIILPSGRNSIACAQTINNTIADVSMTRCVPTNIIWPSESNNLVSAQTDNKAMADVSMTRCVPTNIILPTETYNLPCTQASNKTMADVSMTRCVPTNIILPTERNNLTYAQTNNKTMADVSMTRCVPTNIILPTERNNLTYAQTNNKTMADVSMTRCVPTNIILPTERNNLTYAQTNNKTMADVSMTRCIPTNIILPSESDGSGRQTNDSNIDKTNADVSMTRCVQTDIILPVESKSTRRQTIVYDEDNCDISMTQAIPSNISESLKSIQIKECNLIAHESQTPANIINSTASVSTGMSSLSCEDKRCEKLRTTIYENSTGNLSITLNVQSSSIMPDKQISIKYEKKTINSTHSNFNDEVLEKTIVYEDDSDNILITRALHSNVISNENSVARFNLPGKVYSFNKNRVGTSVAAVSQTAVDVAIPKSIHGLSDIISEANTAPSPVLSDQTIVTAPTKTVDVATDSNKIEESIHESKEIYFNEKCLQSNSTIFSTDTCNTNMSCCLSNVNSKPTQQEPSSNDIKEESNDCVKSSNNQKYMLVYQTDIRRKTKSDISEEKWINMITQCEKETDNPTQVKEHDQSPKQLETASNVVPESSTLNTRQDEKPEKSILDDLLDMKSSSVLNITRPTEPPTKESKIFTDTKEDIKESTAYESEKDKMDVSESATPERKSATTRSENNVIIVNKSITRPYAQLAELITKKHDKVKKQSANEQDEVKQKTSELSHREQDKVKKEVPRCEKSASDVLGSKSNVIENKSTSERESTEGIQENMEQPEPMDTSQDEENTNSTKDIIDLISKYTNTEPPISVARKDDEKSESGSVKCDLNVRSSLNNKLDMFERRRTSYAPRHSIPISREDLFQNISMAKDVLCATEGLGDQQNDDDAESSSVSTASVAVSADTSAEIVPDDKAVVPKKSVVKTLRFDDSVTEMTPKLSSHSIPTSALKKQTFIDDDLDRTDSQKDHDKAHVIPSYLQDVTNNIKRLMVDLVKPNNDEVPFDSTRYATKQQGIRCKQNTSTCSLNVQTDLNPPSQIDLSESCRQAESGEDIKLALQLPQDDDEKTSSSESLEDLSSERPSSESSDDEEENKSSVADDVSSSSLQLVSHRCKDVVAQRHSPVHRNAPPAVVRFDPENPLNNILLTNRIAPVVVSQEYESERYHDDKESTPSSSDSSEYKYPNDNQVNVMTVQYEISSVSVGTVSNGIKSDPEPLKIEEVQSEASTKNSDINVITMPPNDAVFKGNSSLDLSDDVEDSNPLAITDLPQTEDAPKKGVNNKRFHPSPLKPYKESPSKPAVKIKRWVSSQESYVAESVEVPMPVPMPLNMPHILLSCPTHTQHQQGFDAIITASPCEPLNKSPVSRRTKSLTPKKSPVKSPSTTRSPPRRRNSAGKPASPKSCKKDPKYMSTFEQLSRNIVTTIQRVVLEYGVDNNTESSKSVKRSKSEETETPKQRNVLSAINSLPFIKNSEVVWVATPPDRLSFRLMKGRLVVDVQLATSATNDSVATFIRPNTPIVKLIIDVPYNSVVNKNTLIALGVRYAAEAVRHYATRCERAGDLPELLRRAEHIGKVADRWISAMHNAYLHLAYDLDRDGYLTLKVANIKLRTVWRISMRVGMTQESSKCAPVPVASGARVAADIVPTAHTVADTEVQSVIGGVKRDWKHVPRTMWKLFQYLKNK